MTARYPVLIGTLTVVWGSSFMLIEVAVRELAPATAMAARFLLAGLVLLALLAARSGIGSALRSVAAVWRPGLVLGAVNAAVPFFLIAWGQTRIDSGVSAVALGTVPLFTALLAARVLPSERMGGARLAGVAVGLSGVVVLAGADPETSASAAIGTIAVLAAGLSFAAAGLYSQLRLRTLQGPVLATAFTLGGGLILLPFGVVQAPSALPSVRVIGALALLAVVATAFGGLVVFRLIRLHGAARMSLVTYLLPPMALFYGRVILDEPVAAARLGGLALILAGVAVGSGAVRLRLRRQPGSESPALGVEASA
jgi:drug/metabolite transporter (DMT)-like permease